MLTKLYDQDEVLELFIASERREAAKELYANDVPVDIIAKSLKMDVETVKSLVKNLD